MLRVVIVLDFNGINDPNNEMSNTIVENISRNCELLRGDYGATACWVEEVCVLDDEQE